MRALLVALMVALLTGPALAQMSMGRGGAAGDQKPAEPPKTKSTDDKDYKAALSRMPEGKYDPWRTVRGGQPSGGESAPAAPTPAR
jgi:hypothetical protein